MKCTASAASIRPASGAREMEFARALFREYAAWLGVDLCFQGFALELAGLPGVYAPPRGRLLLAWPDNQQPEPVGCAALRPLTEKICEMKRMYVKPGFQRLGIGRRLAWELMQEARAIGYDRMRLDTLAHMIPAIRLYESLGFQRIPAYYETPLAETVFMEACLGLNQGLRSSCNMPTAASASFRSAPSAKPLV